MSGENLLGEQNKSNNALIYISAIILLACVSYYFMLPWRSDDATIFVIPWFDYIASHGVVDSLGKPLPSDAVPGSANPVGTNYTPPYLYLLVIGSYLKPFLDSLTIIKLVSILGTLFCSGAMYYLLRGFVARPVAQLGAAGILILPTVAVNAAGWGQCDAIYTGFLLLTVAAALREKPILMMTCFGFALALKLQAVFLGPFLLYMFISRRLPFWTAIIPALAYAAAMFPAWVAGRPVWELATFYFEQTQAWPWLSMNAPNPWAFVQFLRLIPYEIGLVIGVALGAIAGLGLAGSGFRWRLQGTDLLLLALSSAIMLPYVLPKMAERYFFPADLLAYALAIVMPRRWTIFCAVALQLGSFGGYASYLWDLRILRFVGAIIIGCALIVIVFQLLKVLNERRLARSGRQEESHPLFRATSQGI